MKLSNKVESVFKQLKSKLVAGLDAQKQNRRTFLGEFFNLESHHENLFRKSTRSATRLVRD